MRRASNRRPGWALVWVILTIAIIAALLATAAPSLVSLDDRLRAQRAADKLKSIAIAFNAFGNQVGHYPGNLSELTNTLTVSDLNTCRLPMTATDVSNWVAKAPYVPFFTASNGIWTDIGRISDVVPTRTHPPPKMPIYVELPGVKGEAAAMLDLLVDHGTGDTVTYNAPVNDTTTIRYRVLSSGSVSNNQC